MTLHHDLFISPALAIESFSSIVRCIHLRYYHLSPVQASPQKKDRLSIRRAKEPYLSAASSVLTTLAEREIGAVMPLAGGDIISIITLMTKERAADRLAVERIISILSHIKQRVASPLPKNTLNQLDSVFFLARRSIALLNIVSHAASAIKSITNNSRYQAWKAYYQLSRTSNGAGPGNPDLMISLRSLGEALEQEYEVLGGFAPDHDFSQTSWIELELELVKLCQAELAWEAQSVKELRDKYLAHETGIERQMKKRSKGMLMRDERK